MEGLIGTDIWRMEVVVALEGLIGTYIQRNIKCKSKNLLKKKKCMFLMIRHQCASNVLNCHMNDGLNWLWQQCIIFKISVQFVFKGLSWSQSSWIYNYLHNQCLSPLQLWVPIPLMARCTRHNFMWSSLSVTCDRSVVFSEYSGFPSTNKTDHHDITDEIFLKVALNTIIPLNWFSDLKFFFHKNWWVFINYVKTAELI